MTKRIVAVLFGSVGIVFSARAVIVTPLSSDRLTYGLNRETIPQTTVQQAGPQFGTWQNQVYVPNLNVGDPNLNPNGSLVAVTASQNSTFSSSGVSFTGFVYIDYGVAVSPNPGVHGTSRSYTTFHVDGACPYQLDATFLLTGSSTETTATISLISGTAGPALLTLSNTGTQSGVLAAGDYTLRILIEGDAFGTSQIADSRRQVNATFTIPAPAATAPLLACALAIRRRRRA